MLAQRPASAAQQQESFDVVESVALFGGRGRNPVVNVVLGKLLVMWVLVMGKVLVLVVRLVVVWRRAVGPADVACL